MANYDLLIVDDDAVNLKILETRLQKRGYTFLLADDGKTALELIKQHQFEVVLTDLMMPEIGGLEVLDAVKHHNSKTEVIIMTAYATVDNAVTAMQKGAIDYLQKPVNLEELDMRLKKIALVNSLSKSTDELQTAMEVTERTAAETIKNLEDMIINLQSLCSKVVRLLLDERVEAHKRIPQAIKLLEKAS